MAATARKIQLDDIPDNGQQMGALKAILDWYLHSPDKEFYLAGFAGTGKTTLAGIAVREIEEKTRRKLKILYAAYTGKAANELRLKTGEEASTIHQLIYRIEERDGKVTFILDRAGALADADILILDECSMIDSRIAADLRSFNKRILVLGDPGQLDPVEGEPAFTNRKPDFFMTEIHRQAAESPIIRLATLAREGKPIPFADYGDNVIKIRRNRKAMDYVADGDTQVLCGVNRIRWSVTRWRRELLGFDTPEPQEGERLLCCRNRHADGLFNGAMGTGVRIQKDGKAENDNYRIDFRDDTGVLHSGLAVPRLLFDENYSGAYLERGRHFFDRKHAHFDWPYALSVHKAQGSGFNHVTLLDDSRAFRESWRKWLYTGITRAENGLVIISDHA